LVVAKHRGKIVGSVRITHLQSETDRFELESSIDIGSHFSRCDCVEVSRLCVSQDFEGSDLVHGLMERVTEVALKLGARFVITSAVKALVPSYERLGFRQRGPSFELKTLQGIPHYFLVLDPKVAVHSKGLNPVLWHFTFRGIAQFLEQQGALSGIARISKFRAKLGAILAPVFLKFLRPKSKKHR
jgi:predicted GNAT family N-acyltransferase